MLRRLLLVAGAVLMSLGLVAGHVNRQVLDGETFAAHVDEVRRDDAVAAALGAEITRQIVAANPDVQALRPLIEGVATNVARGDLLSGAVRASARDTHAAIVDGDTDGLTFRVVDAGAIVAAVVAGAAPDHPIAERDISVNLASISGAPLAPTIVDVASAVGTLSWLLPLLGAACFATAVFLARDRWATVTSVGRSLLWAATALAIVVLVGGRTLRSADSDTLAGAVARASWDEFVRPFWWTLVWAVVVAAALLVAVAPSAGVALAGNARAFGQRLLRPPSSVGGRLARGVVGVVVGIAAVVDPLGLVEPLIVLAGFALVIAAVGEVSQVLVEIRPAVVETTAPSATEGRRRPYARRVAVAAIVAALVAGVVVQARPTGGVAPVAATIVDRGCNGHDELCDRPFDEVALVGTHNSMAVASEPGWFLAEQSDSIVEQLDAGVRALLIDVWAGRQAGSVVRTAEGSRPEAREIAERELGPEIVAAALRIADSVAGRASGPERLFMCHGLCETGSTPLRSTLSDIRTWLLMNPSEVLVAIVEDHADPVAIAAEFEAAGLDDFAFEPDDETPWPTLGEMIEANRRLVVMFESGGGVDGVPWVLGAFEQASDTAYTFPSVDDFNCDLNRGPADAPLLLVNHWLSGFSSLVSDARLVNSRAVLMPRVEECLEVRGQIPNIVAVNFADIGDVHEVVGELNGVGEPRGIRRT